MAWRVAKSLLQLMAQVNHLAPYRSKGSDGTIGDARHSAAKSDHNPNAAGVVCAVDITHDPARGLAAGLLAEALRRARDPRIKYVIWNSRMFASYDNAAGKAWTWRPYAGANAHDKHVHVSVLADVADDGREWVIV